MFSQSLKGAQLENGTQRIIILWARTAQELLLIQAKVLFQNI